MLVKNPFYYLPRGRGARSAVHGATNDLQLDEDVAQRALFDVLVQMSSRHDRE